MKPDIRKCMHTVLLLLAMLGALDSRARTMAPTNLQAIQIVADANANQNNPTAVDLVFVYDEDAVRTLPRAGPGWFDQRAALRNGMAGMIDVVSLQIAPGSAVSLPEGRPFPGRYGRAIAVYAYANYYAPQGQAVLNLTPYTTVSIFLAPNAVKLEPNGQQRGQ